MRPTTSTTINLSVKDFLTNNINDGNQILTFTIYDRTVYDADDAEDDEANTDYNHGYDTRIDGTNSATFSIPVKIMIRDTTPPHAWLKPFYWKGIRDNSIYNSASLPTSATVSDLAGHIELEKDWLTATGHDTSKNLYDNDPKVSGKITIEGAANDDVYVQEIWIKINGLKVGNTTYPDFRKVAERRTDEGHVGEWKASANADSLSDDGILWEQYGW